MIEHQHSNCFFITFNCRNHFHLLKSDVAKQMVIDSLLRYSEIYQVSLLGYVIMPNHVHMIILFSGRVRLSDFMRDIKKYSSVLIRDFLLLNHPGETFKINFIQREQLHKIWQDGYHRKVVFTAGFLKQKLNYIHRNPLQEHWKLVEAPELYKYSSANYYYTNEQESEIVTHFGDFFR